MNDQDHSQRIGRISTHWPRVFDAHRNTGPLAIVARRELLLQYSGAIYRYLYGAVGDAEVAEELTHDFAVRLMRGDLRRADPLRGRFRDYLKTVLINQVNDYFNDRKRWPRPLSSAPRSRPLTREEGQERPTFEDSLRDDVIDRTWRALEEQQPLYHAVLLARVQNPDMTSREIAVRLLADRDPPCTANAVRKTLQRARLLFADLLVKEVSRTMESSTPEELHNELKELNVLAYCRGALERFCACEAPRA